MMMMMMKENPSSTCHSIKFKMRGQPSKSIWYNLTLILLRKMSKRKASEISKTAEIPLNDPASTAALTAKEMPLPFNSESKGVGLRL